MYNSNNYKNYDLNKYIFCLIFLGISLHILFTSFSRHRLIKAYRNNKLIHLATIAVPKTDNAHFYCETSTARRKQELTILTQNFLF